MSWLKKGFDEVQKEQQRREESYGVPEVWLKVGEFRDLLFVTDEPACVNRHTAYINGEYQTFTCLADTGSPDVPCCEIMGQKKGRNYTGNYTVIDITPYKDKQGNEGKPAIKLYSAKYKTLQLLRMRQEDQGTLIGKVFRIRRTGDKSVTTGDDVAFVREADLTKAYQFAHYKGKLFSELVAKEDLEKLAKVFDLEGLGGQKPTKLVPFNYFNVLHPKKPAEIRQILRGFKPDDRDSGGSSGTSTPTEDNVPF